MFHPKPEPITQPDLHQTLTYHPTRSKPANLILPNPT